MLIPSFEKHGLGAAFFLSQSRTARRAAQQDPHRAEAALDDESLREVVGGALRPQAMTLEPATD